MNEPTKSSVRITARFEREDGTGYKELAHSVETEAQARTIIEMLRKQPDCILVSVVARSEYESKR